MSACTELLDRDASEIGELYRCAKSSIIESVRYQIACGERLAQKKAALSHGDWLPWLRANEAVLGFKARAAQALIQTAERNAQLTAHLSELTEADATAISRSTWGNHPTPLLLQSNCNEWYTPAQYIEAARAVMGSIDLDPASSAEANATVRARRYFSAEDDGLAQPWSGNVWLNPPYGGKAGAFIAKLAQSWEAHEITAAVALVNAYSTDHDWFRPLWNQVLCFTDHRISFEPGDGRTEVSGATFGSVFAYFGPEPQRFACEFQRFGAVVHRFVLSPL
jgi:phage N-6-adenine-methyltransferase